VNRAAIGGQAVHWSFSADHAVNFNVHYEAFRHADPEAESCQWSVVRIDVAQERHRMES
jgi:hypothetical protein